MGIAILFPGQGAQYFGMGKALYEQSSVAREVFDQAEARLDWQLKDLCFGTSNEKLHDTRYTQPALFTVNYAVFKTLEAAGLKAEAMLGFSLGEYDAIAASGAMCFEDALDIVEKRALYMASCASNYPGGMSAVIGVAADQIQAICQQVMAEGWGIVQVANDNSHDQVTIAGESQALEKAAVYLKAAGARRVIPLKVSGAFHSQLMQQASDRLRAELVGVSLQEPKVQVISNVTARPMHQQEIYENMPLQITHGVRFRESIQFLETQGINTFIEAGPKCTLSGLVKKILPKAAVFQVEDSEACDHLLKEVGTRNAER